MRFFLSILLRVCVCAKWKFMSSFGWYDKKTCSHTRWNGDIHTHARARGLTRTHSKWYFTSVVLLSLLAFFCFPRNTRHPLLSLSFSPFNPNCTEMLHPREQARFRLWWCRKGKPWVGGVGLKGGLKTMRIMKSDDEICVSRKPIDRWLTRRVCVCVYLPMKLFAYLDVGLTKNYEKVGILKQYCRLLGTSLNSPLQRWPRWVFQCLPQLRYLRWKCNR